MTRCLKVQHRYLASHSLTDHTYATHLFRSAPRYLLIECDELDDPAKQDLRVRKRYLAVMKRFTQALSRGGADCRRVGTAGRWDLGIVTKLLPCP